MLLGKSESKLNTNYKEPCWIIGAIAMKGIYWLLIDGNRGLEEALGFGVRRR
jgi:hypothetical protein